MIPYKLLYVGLLLSSVCFFVIGFIGYKKWEKDKNMLSGIMPENTVVEQTPKGKHKQNYWQYFFVALCIGYLILEVQ